MATRSSKRLGRRERRWAFMPSDSNWKRPSVSPREKSSKVSLSSIGILSMSTSRPWDSLMEARQALRTERVLRPRKSIFSRPMGSTKCPSYCVVMRLSPAVGMMGMVSISGSRLMMMPQACTPMLRVVPSRRMASSRMRRFWGSSPSSNSASLGFSLKALAKVIFGVSGTMDARAFASASG